MIKIDYREQNLNWLEEAELACSGGVIRKKIDIESITNDNVAKCKFLFLKASEHFICFITVDSLYIGASLTAAINEISKKYCISSFIAATHTHYMPNLTKEYAHFGKVDSVYLSNFLITIDDTFRSFVNKPRFETVYNLNITQGYYNDVYYRRKLLKRPFFDIRRLYNSQIDSWQRKFKLKFQGLVMAPNKSVNIGSPSIVIKLVTKDRSVAFFSNATHPTNMLTLDSSRDVYSILESEYFKTGNDFIGVQGFSSDLKLDQPFSHKLNLPGFLRKLLFGPSFKRPNNIHLKRNIVNFLEQGKAKNIVLDSNIDIEQSEVNSWLGTYYPDGSKIYYKFHFIKCGPIVFLLSNCEVSQYYYQDFSKLMKGNINIFPIACWAECVGYLPHITQIGSGGYEDDKFVDYFGFTGKIELKLVEDFLVKLNERFIKLVD